MTRRATIRTTHDGVDADVIAAALTPDNTDEMETTVDAASASKSAVVCTRIERETTGGLHATVDDYVVNLGVAATVAQRANQQPDASARHRTDTSDDQQMDSTSDQHTDSTSDQTTTSNNE